MQSIQQPIGAEQFYAYYLILAAAITIAIAIAIAITLLLLSVLNRPRFADDIDLDSTWVLHGALYFRGDVAR